MDFSVVFYAQKTEPYMRYSLNQEQNPFRRGIKSGATARATDTGKHRLQSELLPTERALFRQGVVIKFV